ncbi:MAG: GGDEF domain-containing protein [Lachnospiraceae bacterium]|nr:GGDEF domain-containing protein [Lachnospiraceae bacterium]MDY3657113.1 GGDEF domain-containing protein [Lachnospiraceae bacterium]
MSVDRQQMLETAERLNQQMADGIPYTWETLEQALSFVTEKRDRGIHGRICYFAAFYHLDTGNQEQCLKYLDESVRCLLGTDQEIHVARAYNMIGIVAHMQNNLSLAMEQYGRALDYTAKYNDKMVHSIVLSNMADAYYLIGVYDRAVQCYRECIREFEKAGDDSIYSRINFRKMLSEYGCCLLHLDMDQEAMEVYRKLEETGKSEEIIRETRLAANVFFTYLAESEGHREKAADHVRQAVMALEDMRQVSSEYDSIQNLLQYVEKTGNIELLQEILDCLEPKAAIEQNRSLLLQLLMLRLRYCSAQMSIEEFRQSTETFFHIKESSEMIESNQIMYMLELRKRLQAVEEEQREQTKKRNKLLYQSEHDELTGLYNKRSLNRYLEDVFEACKLNEKELGILFLDIDYFKQLNDRYGHGKGDEGICAVADTLKRIFPEDYVARYGGDEFLVVMTGRDLTYVMEHAELLCAGIREYKIPNEDSELEPWLTISVGGVCAIPKEPNRVWDFLSAADNTLYEQKKEQKGKVRFYQGEGKYL